MIDESQVDKTEALKKEVEKLKSSEQKYKNLFNFSNNALFIIDFEGNFLEVNEVACRRYGYSSEEFGQMIFGDIHANPDKIQFEKKISEIQGNGQSVFNVEHITKNGKKYPIELTAKYFDYTGKPSILIIAKDLTYMKMHAAELEKEREFLHALLDNIPDTIYFKDPESRFTKINKAQARLLGLNDPTEAIGKTDYDFFTKSHADNAFLDEREIVRTKKPMIAKAEKPSSMDGRSRWVTSTKVPILDSKDKVLGIVGISRDITEVKTAEEKILRYTKELQYLNASKDKFFSIIAHDLKNPFVSLLGFSEILLEDYRDLTDEERNEYIQSIFEVSKSSNQLLENLLQWSRAQTGRIEYRPVEVNLFKISDECISLLKSTARKKGVRLTCDIDDSIMVYADRDMLLTIIRNLVTNAIKFTSDGDNVCLSTKTLSNDILEVHISDTGLGMDEETIQKLFRIDVHHTTKGTSDEVGTGLGLILCKEFVEKNGGEIHVESKPGEGSSFIFTLPLHPPQK